MKFKILIILIIFFIITRDLMSAMIDTHMLSLCIKINAFNESSVGAFSCEGGGYISLKQVQTRLQNNPQLYLFRSI